MLSARNTQAPMARTVTIPNATDISIARSCTGTGGGGGGADCSTGDRGGGAYSCMGSRVISWISDTLLGLLVFSPTFCASLKIFSFGKMTEDLVRYKCT